MEVPSVSTFAYDTSLQALSEMATDIVIGTVPMWKATPGRQPG